LPERHLRDERARQAWSYLDDTGAGVHDRARAKRFLSEEDAWAGIHIAELAPTGGEAREWRIARLR
jgi:hypothetical protein